MKKYLIVLCCNAVLIMGCTPQNQSDTKTKPLWEGETVVTVNGTAITEEALTLINSANRGATIPRDRLLDDLIKQELLYQEAERKNLKNNPEISKRVALVTQSILSQAAMQDFLKNSPITDEAIQAAYDKQVTSMGSSEYQASHILAKTEDDAKAVIKKLQDGGDFAELAKKHSIGPSAPKGGSLGWFGADQMVPPFSQAVIALENEKYSQEPVKTQFGWHVIYRESSRPKTPPPLESVKKKLQATLQKEKIEQYLAKLKTAAKIVMTEKPLSTEPAPQSSATGSTPSPVTAKPDQSAPDTDTDTATDESAGNQPAATDAK